MNKHPCFRNKRNVKSSRKLWIGCFCIRVKDAIESGQALLSIKKIVDRKIFRRLREFKSTYITLML
ncbi:hypothetical protein WL05_24785 [Burkholderia ubonensis]|nr:hypothetical protein WJ51_22300 [Burkholderia ubonensis]KVM22527.1 hypothetical protein WJ52_32440 [Burkholderia ubonensis]KVM51025.1 hypothetical protein WJ56_13040 [Burkholderia ubonensis]KVQ74697.1 hypothetical protein WK05_10770 [Burkholderia ubonensis]KVT99077.1 hypothetical protein WK59_25760 [Burkholderia ubonensis]